MSWEQSSVSVEQAVFHSVRGLRAPPVVRLPAVRSSSAKVVGPGFAQMAPVKLSIHIFIYKKCLYILN